MQPRRPQGIVLISVLWVLALLSIIAAGVSANLRDDAKLAGNLVAAAQARHAAEGGVQVALLALLAQSTPAGWQAGDAVHELGIGEATVRFTVASESGKIDLNRAPEGLLEALLQSTGVEAGTRRSIVAAILDWRDADDSPRPDGAEDPHYLAAGKRYGAKDGAFESVDELQLVMGMSAQLFRTLRPALTVHSRLAGVNPQAASRQVLLALRDGDAEDVDQYLEQRERRRQEGLAPPPFAPASGGPLARASGPAFSLHAQARLPNGASAHISALVDLRPRDRKARVRVLDWRHEGPELFQPPPGDGRWS